MAETIFKAGDDKSHHLWHPVMEGARFSRSEENKEEKVPANEKPKL